VEIGRKKLLVLVGSYCVRWEALLITALVGKQNSCGLTHGERERERERERGVEIPRKSGKLH
jgi:hypothetical protein